MLGNAIKHYRNKRKMTQKALANLIPCSIDSVIRWEAGSREPRASELHRLCEILDCTETELLNDARHDECEIVVSWKWKDMKKGEINMDKDRFKVILGDNGRIGLHGAGTITSREGIDEFLGRIRSELEIALEAQIKRGLIKPVVQGA